MADVLNKNKERRPLTMMLPKFSEKIEKIALKASMVKISWEGYPYKLKIANNQTETAYF